MLSLVRLELVLFLIIQSQTATFSAIKKPAVGCKKSFHSSDRPGPGFRFSWGPARAMKKFFRGPGQKIHKNSMSEHTKSADFLKILTHTYGLELHCFSWLNDKVSVLSSIHAGDDPIRGNWVSLLLLWMKYNTLVRCPLRGQSNGNVGAKLERACRTGPGQKSCPGPITNSQAACGLWAGCCVGLHNGKHIPSPCNSSTARMRLKRPFLLEKTLIRLFAVL